MANIFSGMLGGGGGSNAASLAKYNDDLKYQKELYDYQRRNEDIMSTDSQFQSAIAQMTPERQKQMLLFQRMAGQQTMGDKGMEALNKGFSQRGGTIADDLKQNLDQKLAKELWDYKQKNPDAVEAPAKIQVREHFIKQWRADPRNDQKFIDQRGYALTDAELSRISDRQEQQIEQGDQFTSGVTGNVIGKRMLEAGITKDAVANYAPRLTNFQASLDDSEDILNFTENRLDDIRQLSDQTDGWTTGRVGLLLSTIDPGSDAADWERLKDTIVSNIGLDKIMSLKAGSAQGATGLGALNEKELEMLQNYAGNLKSASTPKEIKKILRRLERDLKSSQQRVMGALPRELSFYNDYQQYLPGRDKNTPNFTPSEYQQQLFSGGQYERAEVPGTTLDKQEETREEKLKRLTGG